MWSAANSNTFKQDLRKVYTGIKEKIFYILWKLKAKGEGNGSARGSKSICFTRLFFPSKVQKEATYEKLVN